MQVRYNHNDVLVNIDNVLDEFDNELRCQNQR
jgi:hypothetical protein